MNTLNTTALASALIGLSAIGAGAEELEFNNLFVIGDSLSDAGTYSQAAQAAIGPEAPDINYRFLTNAPDGSSRTYVEVLGQELGINVQPNVINGVPAVGSEDIAVGGTNYAEGGSRVAEPSGSASATFGITAIPMTEQVDRLLADTSGFGDDDLILLWGGPNDVFAQNAAINNGDIDLDTGLAEMREAAEILADQVDRLRNAGAETIVVVTIPDIGTTPGALVQGPEAAQNQTDLSNEFNAVLVDALGDRAVLVDSQKLLGAVQSDPVRYGFTAPDAATVTACPGNSLLCLQGVDASDDSEERIFADGVHPTTSAHQIFGEAAFAGLQAATQTGAIAVATLTALRQQSLSTDNRLNPTVLFTTDDSGALVRREVGDVDVFASIEFGRYEADAQQVAPGLEGRTTVAKAGFDVVVAPNATIGAGISFDQGDVDFDNDAGGFESDLIVGAIFGQIALSKTYYLNAALGGGTIDVKDINRSFNLGAAEESYDASTDGDYRFARIGGGAMFRPSSEWLLNPFTHFTYERVSIDGFTESDGAASLSYGDTEYESQRITLGLSTTYSPVNLEGWRFNLRGSLEHDFMDDDLEVALGPDSDTLGTVSAPRPDQTYGYISGTVVREMAGGSFLSLSASSSVGLDGATGFVGSLAYKMSF